MLNTGSSGKLVLVTGGARSGKSNFAETYARQSGKEVFYIATLPVGDEEMRLRAEKHRQRRPPAWKTFEEPLWPERVIRAHDHAQAFFLLDCLTLLITNHLLRLLPPSASLLVATQAEVTAKIEACLEELFRAAYNAQGEVLIVSNEVGMGLVPDNELGRLFRDLAGRANQRAATYADSVYILFCGLPLRLK